MRRSTDYPGDGAADIAYHAGLARMPPSMRERYLAQLHRDTQAARHIAMARRLMESSDS